MFEALQHLSVDSKKVKVDTDAVKDEEGRHKKKDSFPKLKIVL